MKRFSTLICICSILFVSCDDGTKYVEGQLKQNNYSELINFVKTNEREWSKESGVKLALSGLSKEYYNDVQVRQFFEDEIYEGASELIKEHGIGTIISNCDTSSIMKIFKHVAQSNKEDDLTTNKYLQEAILGYDGEVCADVGRMVADFRLNFVRANTIIDSLESEISAITASIKPTREELDYINRKLSELKRPNILKKCFFVVARHESNQYEARLVQDFLTSQILWSYETYNLKGTTKLEESPHVFEQKPVILESSSDIIEGKGLYCIDVSLIETIAVTTSGGFTANWNVYREGDLEKYNVQREDLSSQAAPLNVKLSKKLSDINKIKFKIHSYNKKIAKYSSLEDGVKPNPESNLAADQLWSEAIMMQSNEKHDEAIRLYKRLLRDYAKGEYGPPARFTLANIYVNIKKEYESAVTEYRKTIHDYPETDYAPESLFMIGFIYANYLKDIDKADVAYKEFLEKYPKSDLIKAVEFELDNLSKDLTTSKR